MILTHSNVSNFFKTQQINSLHSLHFFENRRSFDFRLDLFLQLEKKKFYFFLKNSGFLGKMKKIKR